MFKNNQKVIQSSKPEKLKRTKDSTYLNPLKYSRTSSYA